jgi:hypothetical protein
MDSGSGYNLTLKSRYVLRDLLHGDGSPANLEHIRWLGNLHGLSRDETEELIQEVFQWYG